MWPQDPLLALVATQNRCLSPAKAAFWLMPEVDVRRLVGGFSQVYVSVMLQAGRPLERRRSVRYPLSLPVVFIWSARDQFVLGGFTLNVSVGGAFVVSEQCPAENSEVKLELVLTGTDAPRSKLKLKCEGRVTRVEKVRNVYRGFAVAGCFTDEQLTRLVPE